MELESNCCGASPAFINEELCGDCLEWAEFSEENADS